MYATLVGTVHAETVTFSVVPQQSASKLARLWTPIVTYLSEKTGHDVRFTTAKDIPTFEARLAEGQYDFAYMNPYHYTVFSSAPGYSAFARQKDKRIKGIVVVRKDSTLRDMEELEGERLAFPSPAAFAASVLPRSHLRTEGIGFTPQYVSSHDSVYLGVARGLFPAASPDTKHTGVSGTMSLRLKTILGVAAIEAVLLVLLITTVLSYMRNDSEAALIQRADTVASLFATTSKDAVLSFDLASLESFAVEVMKNPGMVYARVRSADGSVFAEAGEPESLAAPFVGDTSLESATDGVFDQFAQIAESDVVYGRVEIGISTDSIASALANARKLAGGIALAEMLLVALFSYFLGAYLTHQLKSLHRGAKQISEGQFDVSIPVRGRDEVAEVADAFNTMVTNLQASRQRRDEYEHQLQELNRTLEDRVGRRTVSLQEKNAELTSAYETIKAAQAQLLQSEKMASVGQLAAGVAHEINNPVGFINSNLETLKDYVGVYQSLLGQYRQAIAEQDDVARDAALRAIRALEQDEDIDFIHDDTQSLLVDSIEGARRVREIVQGMKNFSRVDGGDRESVDINHCIETSLKMAANELKYKCEVTASLGDVPLVLCNSGQLTQVILNLVVNASHAIAERGEIAVVTTALAEGVRIDIRDNGSGIDPEHLDKLFEPFFTTKPVGQGTGLGLAIVYGIVKDHGAAITPRSSASPLRRPISG